ncbi:MAG: hypothetical protein KGI59_02570 [Patescibacteria group bacterium]|nr:hypothetical protein [Patescibacteria group bacterium]MDE2172369.1 hypothetical protein [Patescibacteria group bacterium]
MLHRLSIHDVNIAWLVRHQKWSTLRDLWGKFSLALTHEYSSVTALSAGKSAGEHY